MDNTNKRVTEAKQRILRQGNNLIQMIGGENASKVLAQVEVSTLVEYLTKKGIIDEGEFYESAATQLAAIVTGMLTGKQ